MRSPAVISSHPFLAGFGALEWAGPVTYYGWDDWLASEPHRAWWPAYEQAFAGIRAGRRRVCGVTSAVVERVAPTGPAIVVPNGLEPAEWRSPGPPPAWFAALPRPRFAYAGSLDRRIDVEQLAAVASAFPDGSVAIAGPMLDPGHFDLLSGLENVTIRPPEGRAAIAGLIAAADACLIPHVSNEMTLAMSPLKLYEYLAAGRPVAATALPPVVAAASSSSRVALTEPGGDFGAAARRALELGPAPEDERRTFIERNSWASRFDTVLDFALN
jgi:glycosyltransferase involved in cell wall biosynthesis